MLSQTVQVGILGQVGPQSQILALEYNRCACRVKQDLTRALPGDRERERLLHKLECKLRRSRRGLAVGGSWTRQDGLWDLVDNLICVIDLDMKTRICSNISTTKV